MKNLLLTCLLTVSTSAMAEVFVTPNELGGEIVLTNRQCTMRGASTYKSLRDMYSRSPTGQMISGCWTLFDGYVQVLYEDGVRRSYDVGIFHKRNDNVSGEY